MNAGEAPSGGPILRFFEARVNPGCGEALERKFAEVSVGVVRDKPGNQGWFFGRRTVGDRDVYVFASVWSDLDAVKANFGEDWQSSHLPKGYRELIAECSVHHYSLASGFDAGGFPGEAD